jgi:hypothetical protein
MGGGVRGGEGLMQVFNLLVLLNLWLLLICLLCLLGSSGSEAAKERNVRRGEKLGCGRNRTIDDMGRPVYPLEH